MNGLKDNKSHDPIGDILSYGNFKTIEKKKNNTYLSKQYHIFVMRYLFLLEKSFSH